jgi:hypothetical protein
MIYSCRYEQASGKIIEWCKGATLAAAAGLRDVQRTSNPDLKYGIVSSYPTDPNVDDGLWALKNLKVSVVHENGTVEVCCA